MSENEFNVDFHMAEYDQLRGEIEMHIADRRKVETQNVIAIIGIYAWLLSRPSDEGLNPSLMNMAMWLPVGIAVYGLMKWEALMKRTIQIGTYLKTLEAMLTKTPEFGWEHSLKSERTTRPLLGQLEGQIGRLFWYALVAATIVFAIWFRKQSGI
jgi:hypothetical protein